MLIVSNVSVRISRWTCERYRWRVVYASLLKENELFRNAIVPFYIGLGLKFDGTKMKLPKKNSTVQTSEIVVRSVCAIQPDGETRLAAPFLAQRSF